MFPLGEERVQRLISDITALVRFCREHRIGKALIIAAQVEDMATRRAGLYHIRINDKGEIVMRQGD